MIKLIKLLNVGIRQNIFNGIKSNGGFSTRDGVRHSTEPGVILAEWKSPFDEVLYLTHT